MGAALYLHTSREERPCDSVKSEFCLTVNLWILSYDYRSLHVGVRCVVMCVRESVRACVCVCSTQCSLRVLCSIDDDELP